jgi:CRP-like cAMP-binding protein
VLGRSAWFGSLPGEVQDCILDNAMLRMVKSGQCILDEDDPPVGLFCVLAGQVAVTRRIGSEAEFFYHLGGPGFWFGESGLLSNGVALVTVTARTETRMLVVTAGRFEQILDSHPGYYRWLAALLVRRYAIIMRLMAQRQGLSHEEFLRIRLADFRDLLLQEGATAERVELALTQTDLAHAIGASRQTVNALLRTLESAGLIETGFRSITVLDPAGLRGSHRKTGL